MRFSTGPSRSCWSTIWPAWEVKRTSCSALRRGGIDVNSNIPFVMLTREFADKLLAAAGEPSLAQLETEIDTDLKPRSRELKGWSLTEKIVDRAARASRPRTWSACWKGPGRMPVRRS